MTDVSRRIFVRWADVIRDLQELTWAPDFHGFDGYGVDGDALADAAQTAYVEVDEDDLVAMGITSDVADVAWELRDDFAACDEAERASLRRILRRCLQEQWSREEAELS